MLDNVIPGTVTPSTTPSDDLPRPPAGRRSATRPAGPPEPVAAPVFSDAPRAVSAPAEPVAPPAPEATAADTAPRTTRTRKPATRKSTTRTTKQAASLEAAPDQTAPVEAAPVEAAPAGPAPAAAEQTVGLEPGVPAAEAPVTTPRHTRTRKSAARPAAEAAPEAGPETPGTEPVLAAGGEPVSELDAALDAVARTARPRRSRRATAESARRLIGTGEVPTDADGAVSTQAVLDSLAAAIAAPETPAPESVDELVEDAADLAGAVLEAAQEAAGEDLPLGTAETGPDGGSAELTESEDEEDDELEAGDSETHRRRRRRGGRRRRRGSARGLDEGTDTEEADSGPEAAPGETSTSDEDAESVESPESGTHRRRRRRRRRGEDTGGAEDDPSEVTVRVREPRRSVADEVTGIEGSTRIEAKKQRRREGRAAGRRRAPILTEAEFLARREAVDRQMVIRQQDDYTQIAVLEDGILVEHYVDRSSANSLIGNIYLGKVQNVLPSMEAAFIDIGRGRNAVLYAGEVDWEGLGYHGGERRIEQALSPGQTVIVQVSKDPVGAKGARLTGHISLPGRYVVYSPDGHLSGISRKLPDTERHRLKDILGTLIGEEASVIVRTAAEGTSEAELVRDIERLKTQWEIIAKQIKQGHAPQQLYAEPDLTLRIVRDLFTEDFGKLTIAGTGGPEDAFDSIQAYVSHVAPQLADRLERWDPEAGDPYAQYRIDEQIAKALERKVFLPSGGSLIIDRTEAMTVIDVNTGKFTGSGGNLEETVTRNNLEAAEEIVRQLRLRDLGGIIVVDFIDMVLPANRELLLRRLVECLGRDRTRHQVSEVTSLGLVQMTRKRIGTGLSEAFTETCEVCGGRGYLRHEEPVDSQAPADGGDRSRGSQHRGGRRR